MERLPHTVPSSIKITLSSAPSRMELGLKVSPREMAHAFTPYIINELQALGKWWEEAK